MPEQSTTTLEPEIKRRLLSIFESLLPLVDRLAGKLRLLWILGLLVAVWLAVWCYYLKHFSLVVTGFASVFALLPVLVLVQFWWTLEGLKTLPEIAGQMVGDAKSGLQESVQNFRAGKAPKLGFFSAGKGLWSVGAMAAEASELLGSYISLSALVNPIMLVLGVVSIVSVYVLFLVGIVLAFFV